MIFWLFVIFICALGAYLRLNLLFYPHSIHVDEARVALNIIDRSYLGLFKPMDFEQVAPPLFLVICKFFYTFIKFNYTSFFSDILLRFFPCISGILVIPAFGYLLQKLFKNKLLTIIGMFLLAINPAAISFSAKLKQYSTEMLVSVIILITFIKIHPGKTHLKNSLYFLLLGFMNFFSMTALFFYPGGIAYLLMKHKQKTKQLVLCTIPLIILIILNIYFILSVYNVHYNIMSGFWEANFIAKPYNFIKTMLNELFRINFYIVLIPFILGTLLLLKKNLKDFLLIASPIPIIYLLSIINYYPAEERLLLFILPCVLTLCLYSIKILFLTRRNYYIVFMLFVILVINYMIHISQFKYASIHRATSVGLQMFEYLKNDFKNDGIILSDKLNLYTCKYYERYYKKQNINVSEFNIEKLKSGIYYLVIPSYALKRADIVQIDNFLKSDGKINFIEIIPFIVPTYTGLHRGLYVKFNL